MNNDIKVEQVNYNSLNLHNCHRMVIVTSPQVDGQFILDRVLQSTEYTVINDSCMLALESIGHASGQDLEKQMSWH
jgi:hypothetical protein